MKTYQVCLLLLVFVIMNCCNNNQTDMPNFLEYASYELAHPDSLLTKKQQKFKRKLIKVIYTNMEVRNDSVVYLLTKDEYLSTGLPDSYYNELIKDMNSLNAFTRRDTLLRKSLEQFSVQLSEIKQKYSE